jgi:hypothetical protein
MEIYYWTLEVQYGNELSIGPRGCIITSEYVSTQYLKMCKWIVLHNNKWICKHAVSKNVQMNCVPKCTMFQMITYVWNICTKMYPRLETFDVYYCTSLNFGCLKGLQVWIIFLCKTKYIFCMFRCKMQAQKGVHRVLSVLWNSVVHKLIISRLLFIHLQWNVCYKSICTQSLMLTNL